MNFLLMNRRSVPYFHFAVYPHAKALSFSHSSLNKLNAAAKGEKYSTPIIGQSTKHNPPNSDKDVSSSIDPIGIHQFDSVSDPMEWLDEQHGCFRPLHSFNRIRIPWILSHLSKNTISSRAANERPLAKLRILDVGCGAGILSLALCRLGAQVTGLDASESVIRIAQKYSETLAPGLRKNVEFLNLTIEDFSAIRSNIETFDAIIASEIVEHVSNLPLFVSSCCKLAFPNSPLFFTTINRTIWSQFLAKTMAEDVLRILPQGLHEFDKFITPQELRKLLLEEQCVTGPVLGLFYNLLINEWRWTNFTEVNYTILAFTRKEN